MLYKICKWCDIEKSESEFYKLRDTIGSHCKVCHRTYQTLVRLADPDNSYKAHIKSKYGLEWSEYVNMAEAQNNKCKICEDIPKRLAVDHCHKTGIIRGLLCKPCNSAIGHFKESLENIKKAVSYLEEE